MTESSSRHPADAVFEGGGVKGIALLGAVSVMEQTWEWRNVAGTSAGAIVAAFIAAGMSAQEVRGVLDRIDLRELMDTEPSRRPPLWLRLLSTALRFVPAARSLRRHVPYLDNIIVRFGMYRGDRFIELVNQNLPPNVRTFGDTLYDPDLPKDSPYRYKLRVIASDVTANRMLVLPQDIAHFGRDPDELPIAEALRMSMSIPVFFEPWKLRDRKGTVHHIVDGGMLSNYPIWLFDAPIGEDAEWPTFGFDLFSPADKADGHGPFPETVDEITDVVEFGSNVWNTLFSVLDRRYIARRHWARTIAIDNCGVSTTAFDLPDQEKDRLWRSGEEAARAFMAAWGDPQEGFDRWKRDYRGQVEDAQRRNAERWG